MIEQSLSNDPDELQLLDESDSEWAKAWKGAAKQLNELEVYVIAPSKQEKKLTGSKKRR